MQFFSDFFSFQKNAIMICNRVHTYIYFAYCATAISHIDLIRVPQCFAQHQIALYRYYYFVYFLFLFFFFLCFVFLKQSLQAATFGNYSVRAFRIRLFTCSTHPNRRSQISLFLFLLFSPSFSVLVPLRSAPEEMQVELCKFSKFSA